MLLFSRFFYLPTVTKKSMQAAPTKQGGTASRKRACVLTHRSAPVPRLAEVAQAREAMTAACITLSSVVGTVPHGTPSLVEFIGVPGRFSCSSKPPLHHTTPHYTTPYGSLDPLTARLNLTPFGDHKSVPLNSWTG
jgi:hypothetical protein